jgi:hypothetical protein
MLLASTTKYKRIRQLGLVSFCFMSMAKAQTINSPYSQFALGDIVPSQNILNRGMGGLSAAYYDYNSVNFLNPASYARLQATSLDLGVELDNRTLRSANPPSKFNAYSPTISYLQLGFPLKKTGGWGMNIGLRPITRVNYKIERNERLTSTSSNDSLNTLFEGSGGAYEAHIGTGFTVFKGLTVGLNVGYLFGTKDSTVRRTIVNDSVFHFQSNHEAKARYGGLLFNAGVQYTAPLSKTMLLRLGVFGNVKQTLNAKRDVIRETFRYNNSTGAPESIDSVYAENDISGDVLYPASYGAGIIFDKLGKWLVGIDYTAEQWSQYRYFNKQEAVRNSYVLHIGGQLMPKGGKSYWSNVAYRAGFSFGTDYISVDKDLPKWSASVGAGLPMRKPAYTNQFSVINIALEVGQKGNKENIIRESFFRVAVGLSLSDIWFIKRKYD